MGLNRKLPPRELPDGQLDLVASGELGDGYDEPAILDQERRGTYTAERFRRLNPAAFARVVELLAAGTGKRRISEMVRCSIHTVLAVAQLHPESVAIAKLRLGQQFTNLAGLASEAVIDDIADPERAAKISAKDKAIIAGIANQHGQLLTGGATARVEQVRIEVTHEDLAAMVGGEVMGPGGGKDEQKEAEVVEVVTVPVEAGSAHPGSTTTTAEAASSEAKRIINPFELI